MTSGRFVFLGFALPDDLYQALTRTDPGLPASTHRFGWGVIECLQSAGAQVDVISFAPAVDWPSNPDLFFRGARFEVGGVNGQVLPFVNVLGLKHLTRYAGAKRAVRRVLARGGVDGILVHGVNSGLLWAAESGRQGHRVPVVAIVTDPPAVPHQFDSRIARNLKVLDRRLVLRGLDRLDGVVALTDELASSLVPKKPALLLDGIARPLTPSRGVRVAADFVYAGALEPEYGVDSLLHSVSLSKSDWTVAFFGRGSLERSLREAENIEPRIRFGGMVDEGQLGAVYAKAEALVNPRPVDADFTRYSFPSKLVEYLASGRPVVTTRLRQIDPGCDPHLVYCGESPAEIARVLDEVHSWPADRQQAFGQASREFVLRTRGTAAQGKRLVQFVGGLRTNR